MNTQTIQESIRVLLVQFNGQTKLFNSILNNLQDDSADHRVHPEASHVKWIAGHLLSSRFSVATWLGIPTSDPYAAVFDHASSASDAFDQYPSIVYIKEQWEAISEKIERNISQLTPAESNRDLGYPLPFADGTLIENLAYAMHHEAYHMGQIGILRKFLGLGPMEYPKE